MIEKTKKTSGADEKTPSVPQYFSWINNTNEGSSEEQTITNLEYFKWLKDTYGMKLGIYALDAGNLDGSSGTYETLDGEKLTKQYPNGYKPLVDKAAESGIRLGVWAGADGYGNTPEEIRKRQELLVGLCRDYKFMEFKFDTVCGSLRPEMRKVFAETMIKCREYSPDLIVLNHRNDLGESEIYATTFLWGGEETYIDVHMANKRTGMHNRVGALERGLVPELKRLTEDHGVCISSCIDYFEDDLILQAFNRSLILAPEIYGNPWLMNDREQARLARIYNLHERYADILTEGMVLPESYGEFAVSRGNNDTRIVTLRNLAWSPKTVNIRLDSEIGLAECAKVPVIMHHPYEVRLGEFRYGDVIPFEVPPFRAVLLVIGNGVCDVPVSYKGYIQAPPKKLGSMEIIDVPSDAETLYEATCFALDNDSLESRSLRRSGSTAIPQVQKCRDAFFDQTAYKVRGCESSNMFDGCDSTFFDGISKLYNIRIDGGCLRVDFGGAYDADGIEIDYYDIDEPVREMNKQIIPAEGDFSSDMKEWTKMPLALDFVKNGSFSIPILKYSIHSVSNHSGKLKTAVYSTCGKAVRYFRLTAPMDHISGVRLIRNGSKVDISSKQSGNNLMAHYSLRKAHTARSIVVNAGDFVKGSCLAVALEGIHGVEGAYCAAYADGKYYGFSARAVSYPSNIWEHIVKPADRYYTCFMPLDDALRNKDITLYALINGNDVPCDVYLCPPKELTDC